MTQTKVMGILNVTPDSFSDGGRFVSFDAALAQVERMISDGADIIDIGGESTRPGALDVSVQDEIDRVIPLLKAIKAKFDVKVSVDTSKAEVMSKAIASGVDIINDVRALQNKGCLTVLAQSEVPVCLMHMQGLPRIMQDEPKYDDVINDIKNFFIERIDVCEKAGIKRDRIIIDPGFGFGKTLEHNYQILANLHQFNELGLPLLSGTSRKSMIGNLLERDVEERLAGSLTTAIIAAQQNANIVRVHDVKETVDALKVLAFTAKYQD
jgi:dihydropteroate synthase